MRCVSAETPGWIVVHTGRVRSLSTPDVVYDETPYLSVLTLGELHIVTRNAADFRLAGVEVIDPSSPTA